jgi:hypothetical protein
VPFKSVSWGHLLGDGLAGGRVDWDVGSAGGLVLTLGICHLELLAKAFLER